MKKWTGKGSGAFTRTELLMVIVVLAVIAVLSVVMLAWKRDKSWRISCVGRQKQIGTAFRVFASDHGDVYPLEAVTHLNPTNAYIVKSGAIGTQVVSSNAVAWQVAQAMWNELPSPLLYTCPSDRERVASGPRNSNAIDFNGLGGAPGAMTTASLGHPKNQNNVFSYAFGVVVDESRPLGVLIVDRNVNNVGEAGAKVASNVALTSTRAVLNGTRGPTHAAYVSGTRMHGVEGNLAYADGSVQQARGDGLRQALDNAAMAYGMITNQNLMLFP